VKCHIISNYIPGSFTQWSADNVDYNVRSLDGHGTLHAMGHSYFNNFVIQQYSNGLPTR